MQFLIDRLPETAETFSQMRASVFKEGALDRKTKELIAVVSSVLMRCEKCTKIHSQRALDSGASKDEIAEAISVAMFISAGSQLNWTDAYEGIFSDGKEMV